MKKILFFVLLALGAIALVACGTDKAKEEEKPADTTTSEPAVETDEATELTQLVIGASNVPHALILEQAKPLLEEQGIELVIETYQDYVLPNKDLETKDLDANYFQHIPYFEGQIADHGKDL